MRISLIAGIGRGRELGRDNKLLWRLRRDLQNFKKLTLGHHVLMGRKTFESIGRPLPGRTNIVLTQKKGRHLAAGCVWLGSLREGLTYAAEAGERELFVLGGARVFCDSLSFASSLYLSRVDYTGPADTFFPEFEHLPWREIESARFRAEEGDELPWSYHILTKDGADWQSELR